MCLRKTSFLLILYRKIRQSDFTPFNKWQQRGDGKRPGRDGIENMGRMIASLMTVFLILAGPFTTYSQESANVTPSPEQLLYQMSKALQDARSIRFHSEITFDDVLVSGEKLQYSGAVDVTLSRPNGVYVDYRDDLSAKRFWYDGALGTLLDVPLNMYSKANLPGGIDAAVGQLEKRYDLRLPLGDLISSNIYAILNNIALAWAYIGEGDVDGILTHHIAIVCENTDLQLWIQKDGPPLLMKFVVTYKKIPQAPQYVAVLMDWDLDAKISPASFDPVLPKGAAQIDFLPAEGAK